MEDSDFLYAGFKQLVVSTSEEAQMQAADRAPSVPSKLQVRDSARRQFNGAVLQAVDGKGWRHLAFVESCFECVHRTGL